MQALFAAGVTPRAHSLEVLETRIAPATAALGFSLEEPTGTHAPLKEASIAPNSTSLAAHDIHAGLASMAIDSRSEVVVDGVAYGQITILAAQNSSTAQESGTDRPWTAPNVEVYSTFSFSGFPSDATVYSITAEWDIDANYIEDVKVYVDNAAGNVTSQFDVDVTGDDFLDGYSQTSDQSWTWTLSSGNRALNQNWYFNAKDTYDDSDNNLDKGRIDWCKLTLYYSYTPPQPDLVVSAVTGTASSYNVGNSIYATATVRNQGQASASSSNLYYYLGTADGSNKTFRSIEQGSVGSLAVNGTANDSINFLGWTIPSDVPAGSYRIWVLADSSGTVAESDETNNWGSSSSFSIIVPQPDLIAYSATVSDTTVTPRTNDHGRLDSQESRKRKRWLDAARDRVVHR
jgi:hypothetical protein